MPEPIPVNSDLICVAAGITDPGRIFCVDFSVCSTQNFFRSIRDINIAFVAVAVTTMGSDRENPGAPNLNGPNGGPQV
jgi:hypothetical protein